MSRPVCICCGKEYGTRAIEIVTFKIELGHPVPEYTGNSKLLKEEYWPALPKPGQPDVSEAYTPMDPTDPRRSLGEGGPNIFAAKTYMGRRGRKVTRTLWDGVSYMGGQSPFCSLRCAYDFAIAARDAGFIIKRS